MALKTTFELLQAIIDNITKTFTADTITDNGGGYYTLTTCDTLWLTLNRKITIGITEYTITELVPNVSIKIKGIGAPSASSFDIYPPILMHGTIIATKIELNKKILSTDKFPLIYLHEITDENMDFPAESAIDKESDCDIHFLTDADFTNWAQAGHDQWAIKPMRNLLNSFENALKSSNIVGVYQGGRVLDHAKWGVYITDAGHTKDIFSENLSGCQLKCTIPFRKDLSCNC